jgi:hypothetical protein
LLGAVFLDEHLVLRDFAGMALIGLGLVAIDGRLWRAIRKKRGSETVLAYAAKRAQK